VPAPRLRARYDWSVVGRNAARPAWTSPPEKFLTFGSSPTR